MRMRPVAFGAEAVLVELEDGAAVRALDRALADTAAPGVVEVVPAAASVLVVFDPGRTDHGAVTAWIARCAAAAERPGTVAAPPEVHLRVRYDGADLEWLADWAGLTAGELIERHQSTPVEVAFCGFSPGFAYLDGFDLGRDVPRLDEPRLRVPAGSLALAARFSAVYPAATPGGWRLLGTCLDQVWDPARAQPALLQPGTVVHFVEAR